VPKQIIFKYGRKIFVTIFRKIINKTANYVGPSTKCPYHYYLENFKYYDIRRFDFHKYNNNKLLEPLKPEEYTIYEMYNHKTHLIKLGDLVLDRNVSILTKYGEEILIFKQKSQNL
jgi:hypothetical protein